MNEQTMPRSKATFDGRLDNVAIEIYRLYLGEVHDQRELERRLTLTWQDD